MTPDRFREQFDQIQETMTTSLAIGPDPQNGKYIYEQAHCLSRGEDEQQAISAIKEALDRGDDEVKVVQRVENRGRAISRIQVGRQERDSVDDPDMNEALRHVRGWEERNGRRLFTRNHIVAIAPVSSCPSDEPAPWTGPGLPNPTLPTTAAQIPAQAPSVLVIDTGLVDGYQVRFPWIPPQNSETAGRGGRVDPEGVLRQYVGHGTFITGLLAATAPRTKITVSNALPAGAIAEIDLGKVLLDLVREGWPDIISLSAGTITDRPEELMGLELFMRQLRDQPRTVLVAAACNNGSSEPVWPAAYAPGYGPAVVSVGALRTDGEFVACFSNYGDWVTVYAPGERVVGAFNAVGRCYEYQHSTFTECRFTCGGDYGPAYVCTCQQPERVGERSEKCHPTGQPISTAEFADSGLAVWSGTSFATPLVAAMIADYLADHPETNPRDVLPILLREEGKTVNVRGTIVKKGLHPKNWSPKAVEPLHPVEG